MKIVIIDDTFSNLVLLNELTGRISGCTPICFQVPTDALVWCETNEPDMVIVDYMMPELNGLEFIVRFRKLPGRAEIPVVMVTAYGEKEVLYKAMELGANDFLTKPIDKNEFVARVKNMLAIRSSQRELRDRAQWLSREVEKATVKIYEQLSQREKIEVQLRQSQKMDAVGQLSGGIAHDFNNILTAIVGYASLLQMKLDAGNPLVLYAEKIVSSAERAAALTGSLLAFSRKQPINLKSVNVNEVLGKAEKLLSRLIGEDIQMTMRLADPAVIVQADSGQIEQVLMNLAINARDAMPQGGQLTITTELISVDGHSQGGMGISEIGEYALITVADTGKGMDEETRERIFEPFFTTKDVGKGTGLGLSIVYGIIRQHNGCITVQSKPGVGTVFRIYLPVVRSCPEEAAAKEIITLTGGTEMIMVAEDDGEVRKLVKNVLDEFGYHVVEAVDGDDAVQKFIENRESIALVILDVVMPKRNGRDACDEIRKMRPDTKVLFMSGYTADVIRQRARLGEGMGLLRKPLSPRDLLTKVREVLDT